MAFRFRALRPSSHPRRRNSDAPRRRRPAAALRRRRATRCRRSCRTRRSARPTHRSSRTRAAASRRTRRRARLGRRPPGRAVVELFQRAPRARRTLRGVAARGRAPAVARARRRREFSAAPGRRSPPDWWETQPWWMRTLPWWLATPRATMLARDPLEAEGSPNTAPTRPFQGTGVLGGAAPGEGCRDATLPSGETCDHYLHVEAKGDRGAFVAKFCPSEAHSRTFAVACCVCGGGAGGDGAGGVAPTKRKRRRTGAAGSRASSSSGSRTAISSSATTGRRRARGSAGRRRTRTASNGIEGRQGGRCPRRWPRRDKASAARCSSATGGSSRALRGSDRGCSYD